MITVLKVVSCITMLSLVQADQRGPLGTCELASARLDDVAHTAAKSGQAVRVVARLGDGELSSSINDFRLASVREYLAEAIFSDGTRMQLGQILLAHGEPIAGLGAVEVFIGDERIAFGRFRRNRDVCVHCCGPDGYGRGQHGYGQPIPLRRAAPK